MKKCLYIGIYTEGSTSKMRGEKLRVILNDWHFEVIDTDIPFFSQNRIFRSLGFRYQIGPLISSVNEYIINNIRQDFYDLIWIDKGVYVKNESLAILRKVAGKLVHYTPDTAFYKNRSAFFFKSINCYDFLITTKQFELPDYYSLVNKDKVLLATQGFDDLVHKPANTFNEKIDQVAFVGLAEKSRELIVQHLIDAKIKVAIAGYKWGHFLKKNRNNPFLLFKGQTLWNQDYVQLISSSYFSLGLLSKKFPELHTTRTFEIPACGTALLTEHNQEIAAFFSEKEALFFSSAEQLVQKINYYRLHKDELEQLTVQGTDKVRAAGFDYKHILERILKQVFSERVIQ